jgi:hypothetical protein
LLVGNQFSKEKIMLKQYIRIGWVGQAALNEYGTRFIQKDRGPRIGVLVALDKNKIGWSLISKKEDLSEKISEKREIHTPNGVKIVKVTKPVWNSERIWEYGTRLAVERAAGTTPTPKVIPNIVKKELQKFEKRVNAYFK